MMKINPTLTLILSLRERKLFIPSPSRGGLGRGWGKKVFSSEKGAILITMLLLMVIVTLIGVIAINTSTVDIQITGNLKRASTAFEGAEGGVDLSIPIIENTISAGQLTTSNAATIPDIAFPAGSGTTASLDTANLGTEITGGADYDPDTPNSPQPDIAISNFNGVEVKADIDRLYSYAISGGSLEFASGYEGIGAAAAGGGVGVLYGIEGQGGIRR